MPESRPTRWQRAKADSHLEFRVKREAVDAAVGTVVSVVVLVATGFAHDAAVVGVTVLGSAVAAALIVPAVELYWNWLQAPMRLLTEDVIAIRERVARLGPQVLTGAPERTTNVRLALLSHVSVGREILGDPLLALGGTTSRIEPWTQAGVDLLNNLVSHDAAEGFLRATSQPGLEGVATRIKVLERIADEQEKP